MVVIDEAQELRKVRGVNLLPSLAYAYDNLRNVKFILGGSEMGLLHDTLGLRIQGHRSTGGLSSR
ncbi:MAG: hypothetical protein QW536_03780 [Metallosphaera sp.]|uniref:hypothetical protein n=1 Tax=Metallosphaera sp. TaxID=2020860 RepID=UPI000A47F9ED